MEEQPKNETFSEKYRANYEKHGVWMAMTSKPDFQGYRNSCKPFRFERRIVDYFYEKLYEQKDSHRHWCVVLRYGSKLFYVDTTLEAFSDWFYSDNILVDPGHTWEYRNRKAGHKKYRNKPRD